jgi:hypothetical protein
LVAFGGKSLEDVDAREKILECQSGASLADFCREHRGELIFILDQFNSLLPNGSSRTPQNRQDTIDYVMFVWPPASCHNLKSKQSIFIVLHHLFLFPRQLSRMQRSIFGYSPNNDFSQNSECANSRPGVFSVHLLGGFALVSIVYFNKFKFMSNY